MTSVAVQLPRMTAWAHFFLREVLSEGDCAVDLTAGKGRDTLVLAKLIGPSGILLSFDIQPQALQTTAALLEQDNLPAKFCHQAKPPAEAGIWLIEADHALLGEYLSSSPRAIVANLGYLPGGDPTIFTQVGNLRKALLASMERLAAGGRIVLVVYIGHPGGREEQTMLEELTAELSARDWHVLRLQILNRQDAPYLLVLEKRR